MPQEKCIKANKYLHAFSIWQWFSLSERNTIFFVWYKIFSHNVNHLNHFSDSDCIEIWTTGGCTSGRDKRNLWSALGRPLPLTACRSPLADFISRPPRCYFALGQGIFKYVFLSFNLRKEAILKIRKNIAISIYTYPYISILQSV